MRFFLWVLSGLLFYTTAFAQNLIPNPGFESHIHCPARMASSVAQAPFRNWFSPSKATPDLFSACVPSFFDVSVPGNFAGYSQPEEGNSYAGLFYGSPYDTGERCYREYLMCRLIKPLIKDSTYLLTFYTRPSSNSPYITDTITIAFAHDSISKNNDSRIKGLQYLTYAMDTVERPDQWHKINFSLKARGDEVFLIIGNFLLPGPDAYQPHSPGSSKNVNLARSAFYLFDDFSLNLKYPPTPFVVDKFFTLNKIYFAFDSYLINDEAKEEIGRLSDFLLNNPGLRLQIAGNADSTGSRDYNRMLSEHRAESVKSEIVKSGIDSLRIQMLALGEDDPASKIDSLNRRVEFKFLSK